MKRAPYILAAALVTLAGRAGSQGPGIVAVADSVFARWNRQTPGCAVGVAQDGQTMLAKAWGMANLEYDVPLGAESIFESGSVAKQFTSAALALLQLEGKLSLDDDVRKHLPEVPDFGTTITIRHLLTHTSGLRDQWGLLSLTGNPPTRQVHTLPLILHLVSRQRELNFPPGSEYLYSNTGYALAAMIVQRVGGVSLARFSQDRFFGPMGMKGTQWRDDFERIVPGRATAYQRRAQGGYAQLMPFTNVYGNGGLLTTVGDLLIWNEALTRGTIPGGKPLVALLETRGRLTSGVTIAYALGLSHGRRYGQREVSHSGSTAGYQTFLTRFPDAGLSIAVLCNTTDGAPGPAVDRLARALLPREAVASAPPLRGDSTQWRAVAGRYRNPSNDNLADFIVTASGLQLRTAAGSGLAIASGGGRFAAANGAQFVFFTDARPRRVRITDADGSVSEYEETVAPKVDGTRLAEYAGRYTSPELGSAIEVRVENGQLAITLPPDDTGRFQPLYADGFVSSGQTVRFARDASGRVTGVRVFAGRVRHVRFDRTP
jgi:YD repeat-containing protein